MRCPCTARVQPALPLLLATPPPADAPWPSPPRLTLTLCRRGAAGVCDHEPQHHSGLPLLHRCASGSLLPARRSVTAVATAHDSRADPASARPASSPRLPSPSFPGSRLDPPLLAGADAGPPLAARLGHHCVLLRQRRAGHHVSEPSSRSAGSVGWLVLTSARRHAWRAPSHHASSCFPLLRMPSLPPCSVQTVGIAIWASSKGSGCPDSGQIRLGSIITLVGLSIQVRQRKKEIKITPSSAPERSSWWRCTWRPCVPSPRATCPPLYMSSLPNTIQMLFFAVFMVFTVWSHRHPK